VSKQSTQEAFLLLWQKHSRLFGEFRVLKLKTETYILKGDTFFSVPYDPIIDRSTQPQLKEYFQRCLDLHVAQQTVIANGGSPILSEGVL
jgi:hypothetical protein